MALNGKEPIRDKEKGMKQTALEENIIFGAKNLLVMITASYILLCYIVNIFCKAINRDLKNVLDEGKGITVIA